jgi:hypothetical protein
MTIAEAQQYDYPETARFFARIVFGHAQGQADAAMLRAGLPPILNGAKTVVFS